MAKNNPIPRPDLSIVENVRRVVMPMWDILNRAFFANSTERVVRRSDLVTLGLVTDDQLNDLED